MKRKIDQVQNVLTRQVWKNEDQEERRVARMRPLALMYLHSCPVIIEDQNFHEVECKTIHTIQEDAVIVNGNRFTFIEYDHRCDAFVFLCRDVCLYMVTEDWVPELFENLPNIPDCILQLIYGFARHWHTQK